MTHKESMNRINKALDRWRKAKGLKIPLNKLVDLVTNTEDAKFEIIEPKQLPMNHKDWLDNEYNQWIKALHESTVHNFKEHPMVKRMLGETEPGVFATQEVITAIATNAELIYTIDQIGYENQQYYGIEGTTERYVYYALEILKRNPSSIVEIGGGVGQFYAILRALGYKGEYFINDLREVQSFQKQYLAEVHRQTGLRLDWCEAILSDFICSFYAIGEFDDYMKKEYFDYAINDIGHGYIAWNPHSGASDDLSLFKHDIKVTPGIEPGIKIIEW